MCILQSDIITFKKATLNNIQGLFQGFSTLIINIEGKNRFFVRFWHQTFLALVISISTLDYQLMIHQILPFFLAKKLIFNPLLPRFLKY